MHPNNPGGNVHLTCNFYGIEGASSQFHNVSQSIQKQKRVGVFQHVACHLTRPSRNCFRKQKRSLWEHKLAAWRLSGSASTKHAWQQHINQELITCWRTVVKLFAWRCKQKCLGIIGSFGSTHAYCSDLFLRVTPHHAIVCVLETCCVNIGTSLFVMKAFWSQFFRKRTSFFQSESIEIRKER